MQEPYQNKDGALCDKITWFAFEKKQKSLTGTHVTQKLHSLLGHLKSFNLKALRAITSS